MQTAFRRRTLGLVVALSASASALCQTLPVLVEIPPLAQQIQALVAAPAVSRAHWGVMVTAMNGTPIYAMNEAQLFQPASNTKLFTTAAALGLLGPDRIFETRVEASHAISSTGVLPGNLNLVGGGDANFAGRLWPYSAQRGNRPQVPPLHDLEQMADEVAAKGLKVVQGDIVGDDTYFQWEPYGPDWAVDDLPWGYGAPASALSVDDNQVKMTISAAKDEASHAQIRFEPEIAYYNVQNDAYSSNPFKNPIGVERAPGTKLVKVFGGVDKAVPPDVEELAILDPAEYAAIAFKAMLEARGVKVSGIARSLHHDSEDVGNFLDESKQSNTLSMRTFFNQDRPPPICDAESAGRDASEPVVLASHSSPPLRDDVLLTNKLSQNLHAEVMLRNVGEQTGGVCNGGLRFGLQAERAMALNAGIDPDDFIFFDGSGLSGHDLVTPRAIAKLLQFASRQPWFADYKASLPIGGVDGTLQHRFTTPPLKGHVFAKTGTLGEARALSGYLECASGRTVIFSVMEGNHAPGQHADRDVMDHIVAAIAAAN
jgi:D-alanyl-D-alanine carboxypeptidase/D-alanyl-D-alanine-endopeptidase (penicillin-binding protein 4)